MTYASQLLRHPNKLRNGHNVLQHEPAVLIRYFSKDAGGLTTNKRADDISIFCLLFEITHSHSTGLCNNLGSLFPDALASICCFPC